MRPVEFRYSRVSGRVQGLTSGKAGCRHFWCNDASGGAPGDWMSWHRREWRREIGVWESWMHCWHWWIAVLERRTCSLLDCSGGPGCICSMMHRRISFGSSSMDRFRRTTFCQWIFISTRNIIDMYIPLFCELYICRWVSFYFSFKSDRTPVFPVEKKLYWKHLLKTTLEVSDMFPDL